MKLRKYQKKLVRRAMDRAREHGAGAGILIQLPTGGGKTAIGCELLNQFAHKLPNRPHAWLTHRRELRDQSGERIEAYGLDTISMADTSPARRGWYDGVVNIVSPSLRKWPVMPDRCGLLVIDEAHHTPAASWSKLVSLWTGSGGIAIGLTATPWRLSRQQGFEQWYDDMICGPSVRQLQDAGWLATPRVECPFDFIDFSTAQIASTGDYTHEWMESEVLMMLAHKPVVKDWHERTVDLDDRRTLWFTPTVRCAYQLATELTNAVVITGDTPAAERDKTLQRLESGKLTHLVSVEVISEGIDIPSVPVIASLRPTQSLVTWLQQCGRGNRPKGEDGGYYHVLDYAGNAQRHGVPDLDRSWSLEPRTRHRGGKLDMPASHCWQAECSEIQLHPAERYCWHCGEAQWFECEHCHVARRWTQYPRGRKCRVCTESEKQLKMAHARRKNDDVLNAKFASRRRAKRDEPAIVRREQMTLF